MQISKFATIVHECATPYNLDTTALVIDAQNFLYNCYENSRLPFEYGAECDRYADYLKRYLGMFKEANITCYFIFKGGTKNLENKILRDQRNTKTPSKFNAHPNLVADINLQVLDDMKFQYIFTEYEAKTDCIALAKRLSCPVLSMDIEFALSGVTYIPSTTLKYDDKQKRLNCKRFSLDTVLEKFKINIEKLAIFILLTDETYFAADTFKRFLTRRRIKTYPFQEKNKHLLMWLSTKSEKAIVQDILKESGQPSELIFDNLDKARKIIARDNFDLVIDYFFKTDVTRERWFEAGVALNIIAKPYIDVYRSNILIATGIQFDDDTAHPLILSLNIIKYAYDLLTNFQNSGFKFLSKHWDSSSQPILVNDSIKKPNYQAKQSIFENGWDDITSIGLFQHFMIEEVNFKFHRLERVPADAKLLVIALVYFHHKKTENSNKIAYGMILSYIMLGVVKEIDDNCLNHDFVSASDSKLARTLLDDYFNSNNNVADENLQSLSQFQYCLKEINYLNKLCGSPFEPTIYSKTVNSTFVYNIVDSMQIGDENQFIHETLASAPTVIYFLNHIIELYNDLLR